MKLALTYVLVVAWAAVWFCGCGGAADVSVQSSNQQSQEAGGDLQNQQDASKACEECLGNPEDDQSDAECLEQYGLSVEDC